MIDWSESLQHMAPILAVAIAAGVVLIADLLPIAKKWLWVIALIGLAGSIAVSIWLLADDEQGSAFADTLVLDNFSAFFQILVAGATAIVVLASVGYTERFRVR